MSKSLRLSYVLAMRVTYAMLLFLTACAKHPQGPLHIEVVAEGNKAQIHIYEQTDEGLVALLHTSGYVGAKGSTSQKREGDGKSPLGIYRLGRAFGTAPAPEGMSVPYTMVQQQNVWVDDANSRYYNQWASDADPDKDWSSAERLINESVAYKHAAVVEYNTNPIVKDAGSAIFVHCIKGNKGTAGCVSMPEKHMRLLLQWLKPQSSIAITQKQN